MIPLACAGCGRRADGPTAPWTWSRTTDDRGRESLLCETCVRTHARDIEAKLPDDWWE
ncbi:hypothetical protein [Mariniluteicoccus flavus]